MKFNLKWPVVLLALVLTVSCIYGVNYWRQQRFVDEPLIESLFKIDGVEDVTITNANQKNNLTEVSISLLEVENFSKTYKEIEEVLNLTYELDSYQITVLDTRDPYLESLYDKIHFALMEGERRGNYSNMKEKVSHLLNDERNLKYYHLRVDQKRIYLQLSSEENYLYEIIPIKYTTEVS